jgi:hypothetical protein
VRLYWGIFGLFALLNQAGVNQGGLNQAAAAPTAAVVQDQTHFSQVMAAERAYRVFLPPVYATSQKRYPVVYWLHGYEQSTDQDAYAAALSSYVATHDLIAVDAGPVETTGAFPLYFPELVEHIDQSLRTVADRDHRAVSGFSTGGFLAWWIAGKYPDLISSAGSLMGSPEAPVGPNGFDVESSLADLYGNYDGVRTRLVTSSRDFALPYHRQLDAIFTYATAHHEIGEVDAEHGITGAGVASLIDFHLQAFAKPLPKPGVFNHADVYPNFSVWGWEVASDRRQPGATILRNVSAKGFQSVVQEWLPGGAAIPSVKLSISTPRVYQPSSAHPVTYIRLRDGKVRRAVQKADTQGRLNFDLDGEAYEVGVAAEALIAVSGYEIVDAAWATAGKPVKVRVKFWNKGAARSGGSNIQWECTNPGVKIESAASRLFGLGSGESVWMPVTFTVDDPARAIVHLVAVEGANRMPVDIPLFPAAEPVKDFLIADGRPLEAYQHATRKAEITLGEGNGDGFAAPGESFAILLPDDGSFRVAELFTNDACIDNTVRLTDSWSDYDRAGASVKYSVPKILAECEPGRIIHMLARVMLPDHQMKYAAVEFPVWWRHPEDAYKK